MLLNHDSATLKHINEVRANLWQLITELDKRAQEHDASKFQEPERSIYAANLPKLGKTVYGSPEYKALMEESRVAIDHHYSKNRHHAEHWPNGVDDMDLIDIVEMLSDWAAASKRNKNGNIHRSIAVNTERYNLPPMMVKILTNTANRYF